MGKYSEKKMLILVGGIIENVFSSFCLSVGSYMVFITVLVVFIKMHIAHLIKKQWKLIKFLFFLKFS